MEPPRAIKSPVTGAVTTIEIPAVYALPGEELATSSVRAAEKEAGAALVDEGSMRRASAISKTRCIRYAEGGIARDSGGVLGGFTFSDFLSGSMRVASTNTTRVIRADARQ
jgi:hypothetical protein